MSSKSFKLEKRKLYFGNNSNIFIEIELDNDTLCQDILTKYNNSIIGKLKEIYGENYKNKKFYFIAIITKINNKSYSSFTEFKVDMKSKILELIPFPHCYLLYKPIEKVNMNLKRRYRNGMDESQNKKDNVELDSLRKGNIEKYINNEKIFWLNKKSKKFEKVKGNVDELKVEINNNQLIIPITKLNDEFYDNKIPPEMKDIKVKEQLFFFKLNYNNEDNFFFADKLKTYLIWKNGIEKAKIKSNNFSIDSNFNNIIDTFTFQLYVISNSMQKKLFILQHIFENEEKRKIFLEDFKEAKISQIILNIFSYKKSLIKNNYFEAFKVFKSLVTIIDLNNEKDEERKKIEVEKYSKILTQERIKLYNDIFNKANELVKDIKVEKGLEEEYSKLLKPIMTDNIFDELYVQIFKTYIEPYFKEILEIITKEYAYDKKPSIVKKFHSLLSYYCLNYFDMKNISNFNYLQES